MEKLASLKRGSSCYVNASRDVLAFSMTITEYAALRGTDRFTDELDRGRLVREPRPVLLHTLVAGNVYDRLREYQLAGRGLALIEGGFLLRREPPTVRGPDVAFVLREHVPTPLPDGWLEGAPDLAVEVLSPSNREAELEARIRDLLEAGTQLLWVLDPARRTVVVRTATTTHTLHEGDVLSAAPVLPDLTVRVGDLYRI